MTILPFEEVKHCHLENALQQVHDRNGPEAKRMIGMISNPPPPFESDDNDSTMPYIGEGGDDVNVGTYKVVDGKDVKKVDSSNQVEKCVSNLHKQTEV
jgi:hypothetical protein